MFTFPPLRKHEPGAGLVPWLAFGLACLLAGCGAGIGNLPEVDGPLPRLDPAPAEPGSGPVAHLPKDWLLYTRPPEVYGTPVLTAAAGSAWTVTGHWRPPADIPGRQGWLLDRTWYRLHGDVAPWGRVHLWGQLPDDWIRGDRDTAAPVDPVTGAPWHRVPHSAGHVLAPIERGQAGKLRACVDAGLGSDCRLRFGMELRACPEAGCPVLARPEADQLVPVTGRLTDTAGREWLRVEFRQMILWVPASTARLRIPPAVRLRRHKDGWRSCEPAVMFPPPPHTLCPVDKDGRFLDDLERAYDRLDPVLGRLPALAGGNR